MQSVEDTIVENAEVAGYNVLLQLALRMNIGDALPILRQSLKEEDDMYGWLRANAPATFAKLWPEIVSPSSMTFKQAKAIRSIEQMFTCEECNNAIFNSREQLKQHVVASHH